MSPQGVVAASRALPSDPGTRPLTARPDVALKTRRRLSRASTWRLDRLGRSLRHLVETVTALAARGVGFRSLQESIDTTTPGGRLVFHVFAALAEFERDLISERTRAGLAAARARGRKGGRPTVMTPAKLKVAQEMYASREHTTAAIASVVGVSRATLYRALAANPATASSPPAAAPSSSAKQASVIVLARPSACETPGLAARTSDIRGSKIGKRDSQRSPAIRYHARTSA